MSQIVLLGPQRLSPTVGAEVKQRGITGPVAMITAGWQEREEEDSEFREVLAVPAVNLRLYARWEEVRQEDPEFGELHRSRQDQLRQLSKIYRLRLALLRKQASKLLAMEGSPELLDPERIHAIDMLKMLDAHHLRRVEEINGEFEWAVRPGERASIARHRAELMEILQGCEAIAIAGGHVAVLLNRLRLFNIEPMLRRLTVFAWSAGAMTLTERIVLFHDSPPQGAGNPEVLELGLGLIPGVVVLPSARHRLKLEDAGRVALMVRRLSPSHCVPMDEQERLEWSDSTLSGSAGLRMLRPNGSVAPLEMS
ncbi:MAG: hypothetical protein ACI8RZ_002395 [Myxococcota bacterium]|jgi:hypothetical protein